MKLVLHGPLREKYGESYDFIADNVADAIEGWSRQVGTPRGLEIQVAGFDTEESLYAKTDVSEVHLVPAMFGGGGVAKIIVGAVMVVIGVFVPGMQFMVAMGAGMILQGVMSFFVKAPSVSKQDDPPPSKYLGLNQNTTGIGTLILNAWGTVKIYGHWLSLQSAADEILVGSFPENPT